MYAYSLKKGTLQLILKGEMRNLHLVQANGMFRRDLETNRLLTLHTCLQCVTLLPAARPKSSHLQQFLVSSSSCPLAIERRAASILVQVEGHLRWYWFHT